VPGKVNLKGENFGMKSSPALLLGLVLFGLLFTPGNTLVNKDYYAEQFDVGIVARPDGSILVTETTILNFIGGPFTYVYREISTKYTDGIIGITASMDGKPLKEGVGLVVTGDDPVHITWHFDPIFNSTHTFILSYRALGVIQVAEEYDLLRWNAIPFNHDYPIQASTVRVTYPRRSKLVEKPTAIPRNVKIDMNGSQVELRAKGLKEDGGLQFTIKFSRNSLISEPPMWQQHQVAIKQAIYRILPWTAAVFALFLILGVGVLFFFWEQNANIDRSEGLLLAPGTRVISPPSDLPPAYAGILVNKGTRASWPNALATLLDLAQRGLVSIEECVEKKWFRKHDFELHLKDTPVTLRDHERGLLEILFFSKRGPRSCVKISELHTTLPYRFKGFSESLTRELAAAGLVSPVRQMKGNRLLATGVVLLIVGLIVFILSLVFGGASINMENWLVMNLAAIALGFASSAILIGFVVVILAGLYSPLTDQGLQEAGNWRTYSEYLRDVIKEREPVSRPDLFETALPYAASFGMAESWSRFFEKHGNATIPPWFQTLAKTGYGESMSAFVAMMAATSAEGSSSTGGNAGAGAAGGGSSGAG
jgi:hypothetical protein